MHSGGNHSILRLIRQCGTEYADRCPAPAPECVAYGPQAYHMVFLSNGMGRPYIVKPAGYFRQKSKEGRPKSSLLTRTHGILLACCHRLNVLDLAAVIGTALRAHSVRQMQRAALGACHETGSRQLPNGAASLIASLLGYFSLRYCHVDTSLALTA